MVCQGMRSWTFTGIVGAFLDLAIAYFLLCASTLAFFASRFLGLFGLYLPCPCNGPFGNPNSNFCLQRLLVDFPTETVSSVQLSVKNKFPFDPVGAKDRNYEINLKLVRDRDRYVDGFVKMEGEASCSSISGPGKSENVGERDLVLRYESGLGLGVVNSSLRIKEGRFDTKGKGIINQKPRSGLRRRRKCVTDCGKVSSVSSCDPSCTDAVSPLSINHKGFEGIKRSSVPAECGVDANRLHYEDDTQILNSIGKRVSHGNEQIEPLDDTEPDEKNVSYFEERKSNSKSQKELGSDDNDKNAIRILEQALEEERAACAALYLELEKERSAAASAADEAMAMILRLQEEKASIEMEARQYHRMIEEKSTYDAEEMNILKEILVRRETEKHFLEKEVEAYRQMIYDGNQQLLDDIQSTVNPERDQPSSLDLGEDLGLMLQQLSESIDKKEIEKEKGPVNEFSSIRTQNDTLDYGRKLKNSKKDEEADIPEQGDLEKQFLYASGSSQEHNFTKKSTPVSVEQKEQNDNAPQCRLMAIGTTATHNVTDIHLSYAGENLEQYGKNVYDGKQDPDSMKLDMEPCVYDVHVIDGEFNFFSKVRGNKNEWFSKNDSPNIHSIDDLPLEDSEIHRKEVRTDSPSTIGVDSQQAINRRNTDITAGLPPLGASWGGKKSVVSDLRRNSMSAVDNERLRIDSEVGSLREKLRIVQEEREKLNFSVGHRERETFQVQLLEDIACQLREIRQLSDPGKAVLQASLPLPFYKVTTKKRRHRSVSLGVHNSS